MDFPEIWNFCLEVASTSWKSLPDMSRRLSEQWWSYHFTGGANTSGAWGGQQWGSLPLREASIVWPSLPPLLLYGSKMEPGLARGSCQWATMEVVNWWRGVEHRSGSRAEHGLGAPLLLRTSHHRLDTHGCWNLQMLKESPLHIKMRVWSSKLIQWNVLLKKIAVFNVFYFLAKPVYSS